MDSAAAEECDGTVLPAVQCPTFLQGACRPSCTEGCLLSYSLVPVRSDGRLKIYGSGRFAHLDVPPEEYAAWIGGQRSALVPSAEILRTFEDVFDFIVFVTTEDELGEAPYVGRARTVRNDAAGIGQQIFDFTNYFGLPSRLQTSIHLTTWWGLRYGPSLHELAHRWANNLRDIADDGSHWGLAGVGGQLGGWSPGTLRDLGGGVYEADGPRGHPGFYFASNGGNSVPYAPLELYLMGMADVQEVPSPIQVADNWTVLDPTQGTFTASGIREVTIEQILSTEGPRIPASDSSQHDFRALVVVVTDRETPVERLVSFDRDVRLFGYVGDDGEPDLFNFYEATLGRGTIRLDGLFDVLRASQ